MTSFRFNVGAKGRRASRFIGRVRGELLQAFVEQQEQTGLTPQTLAKTLRMRRPDLNRQLNGEDALTLRAVAEIAAVLGREIIFELRPSTISAGQNFVSETSTVSGQFVSAGATSAGSSTLPSRPQIQSAYDGETKRRF